MSKQKFPSRRPSKAAVGTHLSIFRPGRVDQEGKVLATRQLDQMREELELLTSYTSDTIYRLRYDTMTYDYVSPSVVNLLGFSAQEIRRMNIRELILETRLVTNGLKTVDSFDELEQKRKEGDVNKWQADYLMRTKNGAQVWVSDVSYPWFDEAGRVIGSVGSLRDVTDRVQAETQIKEELAKVANTDALTGLANRREFFHLLEREIKRMHRTNNDVSLLLLDIDHFKQINDAYGHDIGDKVLVEVAGIIRNSLRETDLPSRIGGEEFAVMLPDTPSEGAYWVAERIRMAVLKHTFTLGQDKQPVNCTISIGVSSASMGEEIDASGLYKLADTRLYIAKNTGRNQVSVDEILHTH